MVAKADVVFRARWAAVKKRRYTDLIGGGTSFCYDIWQWNVFKMKWVRVLNACGYGDLEYAERDAREMSRETQEMLDNNRTPPEPLT